MSPCSASTGASQMDRVPVDTSVWHTCRQGYRGAASQGDSKYGAWGLGGSRVGGSQLGFRVQDLGFRVQGLWFGVRGLRL
jgi:hypothetical protein